MTHNVVGWFEIYVQNMSRAKRFYESVLAISLEKLENDHLEMWMFPGKDGAPGASGALAKMDGVPSGGGGTMVYFMCEDCAAEESRVLPHGGKIMKGKFSIGPYGFISIVEDTEGNCIGLHSMK